MTFYLQASNVCEHLAEWSLIVNIGLTKEKMPRNEKESARKDYRGNEFEKKYMQTRLLIFLKTTISHSSCRPKKQRLKRQSLRQCKYEYCPVDLQRLFLEWRLALELIVGLEKRTKNYLAISLRRVAAHAGYGWNDSAIAQRSSNDDNRKGRHAIYRTSVLAMWFSTLSEVLEGGSPLWKKYSRSCPRAKR